MFRFELARWKVNRARLALTRAERISEWEFRHGFAIAGACSCCRSRVERRRKWGRDPSPNPSWRTRHPRPKGNFSNLSFGLYKLKLNFVSSKNKVWKNLMSTIDFGCKLIGINIRKSWQVSEAILKGIQRFCWFFGFLRWVFKFKNVFNLLNLGSFKQRLRSNDNLNRTKFNIVF